jgi:hypothetical protein
MVWGSIMTSTYNCHRGAELSALPDRSVPILVPQLLQQRKRKSRYTPVDLRVILHHEVSSNPADWSSRRMGA